MKTLPSEVLSHISAGRASSSEPKEGPIADAVIAGVILKVIDIVWDYFFRSKNKEQNKLTQRRY